MSEFNVNVNVKAPALEQAINNLAAAFMGGKSILPASNAAVQTAPVNAPAAPVQPPQAAPQPTAPGAVQAPVQAPVQQPQAAPGQIPPVPQPQPQAPAAPQPAPQPQGGATPQQGGVTLEAIINAGAGLVEKGMMAQVVALLGKYGLQAVNQLQPAQYAPFAAELRALGAAI